MYALLDPGAMSSFVTPIITMKFEITDISNEPFSVSTPVGDSVVDKRVCKGFPISLTNRVTLFYLIELDMLDFNVIFGMDLFRSIFSSIDCRLRVVKFQFSNDPIF